MFCTKCGNQLKEGSKFCTKCGAPVKMPEPVPVAEAQPEPVAEPQPKTVGEAQPAPEKAKNSRGISLIFGIIAAALCAIALIQYIVGCLFNYNPGVFRTATGALIILDVLAFTIGIATGILSKKLPVLAIIPFPLMLIANLVGFGRTLSSFITADNKGYVMLMLRQQIPFILEIVIGFIALAAFIIAVVTRKKAGVVFGIVSMGVSAFLTLFTLIAILAPIFTSFARMHNPMEMLLNLKFRLVAFSRVLFYASYIALSLGLMLKNRKLSKG